MKELELYVHIPFCRKKCNYCDFVSFADCLHLTDRYVSALCREITQAAAYYKDREIVSVYIGGGTPSILNCGQMEKILDCLNTSFRLKGSREKRRGLFLQKKIRPSLEFSIEVNPESADREKLKLYRSHGINRLSIGLQSTDDKDLKMLGRVHSLQDFTKVFEEAREAGFDNINIDLMQAIPGQTLPAWRKVLALAGSFRPEHISAYSLMIEEGTAFHTLKKEGKLQLPDEDTEREIYYDTRDFLEKTGYHRYEISNYALPGFECAHNCGYWKRTDYLGLGLHASSMVSNTRWKNTADLMAYLEAMENFSGISETEKPFRIPGVSEPPEVLSRQEQMEEFMFLGLRMTEGVSKKGFFGEFGQDLEYTYADVLPRLRSMELIASEGDRIFLTDRGLDVSNPVLAEFVKVS
ncbi:MAG: oxygen-independent coproporphyrinogen III oxidase [Parasporobacterium sp.]|nr:oxygen-independent coproporphyrinogen III oxidase [Parasporobacterium sp.]